MILYFKINESEFCHFHLQEQLNELMLLQKKSS